MPEAERFLGFVSRYILRAKVTIRDGETLAYGYWLTKFVAVNAGNLDVWEYASSGTHFSPGATLTLTYWREQHAICEKAGTEFRPPRPDELAAVSPAVLEGASVQGVRYPSPAPMSGWWITADDYTGDIKMLGTEHLYHLTDLRPDLARYLALPQGFRFDLANYEDVWFDRAVADQSAI